MAQIEPMDIDSEFDNKENSLHHSNVLSRTPCTEKGYEELDVSELNMKLRYSITPASSPMSKSFTANSLDNKTYDSEDYLSNVVINENCNLTRSLNSTITRNDMAKLPKSLPLQELSSESITDNRNISKDQDNNLTITLNGQNYLDDNMSLPSTSSTPEAITPTKEIPKHDGGSPIMRGLKSVLNMFRSSQSPIPPADVNGTLKQETLGPKETILTEDISKSHIGMASTPISNKQREVSISQRSSPLKESIVFNDDLERELQWKDETTILFKEEKIPIHKLLLPQSLSSLPKMGEATIVSTCLEKETFNNSVEHMDISYNDSFLDSKTGKSIQSTNTTNTNDQFFLESDGEFVDCETTIHNDDINDNIIIENLTKPMTSENITLSQSSYVLQVHTEQQLNANNQSETSKNLPTKEYYSQTNCDKSEISTSVRDDCTNQEILADSAIKSQDSISNTVEVVLAEYQNEKVSQVIEEMRGDHKFNELINNNNSHNNIPTDTIFSEHVPKEHNIKIKETLANSNHPSNIPLPDEDDIEKVINFDLTMPAVKLQELNLKADQKMNMRINHTEIKHQQQDSSQSDNMETNKLGFDCIEKNEVNNQVTVLDNSQSDELIYSKCTDKKDNVQANNLNDNLTLKVDSAPEEAIRVTLVDGELETNSKIELDSLETNNEKFLEAVTIENKTKCDPNINKSEDNIKWAQDSEQTAITENINEIAVDMESYKQNIDNLEQEQDTTYIFDKNNLEKLENVMSSNSRTDNTFTSINNDVKDCVLEEKFHVYDSEVSSKSNIEEIPVCIATTNDNMNTATVADSSSYNYTFVQQENKSLENIEGIALDKEMLPINRTIKIESLYTEKGEETLSKEAIQTSNNENTIARSIENELGRDISQLHETYMCVGQDDLFKKIEIEDKSEKFDYDTNKLYTHVHCQENETVENNSPNNEMVCNPELVNHVVTSNETFNMSIGQEDEIEKKVINEITNECEYNTSVLKSESLDNNGIIPNVTGEYALSQHSVTVYSSVVDETNRFCQKEEIGDKVENYNLNNEMACNSELVSQVTTNATSDLRVGQEDEIGEKVIKENANECENGTYEVIESESLDIRNVIIQNEAGKCALNQHSVSSVLDEYNRPCQKGETEQTMIYERQQYIDAPNEILDGNNGNGIVKEAKNCDLTPQNIIASNSKIDNQVDSNIASDVTFNMSIDQEDISEMKENMVECVNLLNIRTHENEVLVSNNDNGVVVDEIKECILNLQNEMVSSNSNIDDSCRVSNVISNATFDMSICKEHTSENKEIKEKLDKSKLETNETGEFISNLKQDDCAVSNTTYISDNNKEENNLLNQMSVRTQIESENNAEPEFLSERKHSPSKNLSIKADVTDQRKYLDNTMEPLNMDSEIKNDHAKQVEKSMEKSFKTLKLSSSNGNDKVGSEKFDEKSEGNSEIPGDCSRIEMKSQESPPLSPVISSKGYNFNFDEIDDPFATKTKIRSSPPPDDCTRSNEKVISKMKSVNINKKDFQRRKSMPVKRQPPSLTNKINSTFSEAIDYKEIKQDTKSKGIEKMGTEIEMVESTCDNSQISVNLSSTILEKNSVQTEETHNYIDMNNDNVHKSEEHSVQIETLSSHEAESTSNLSRSHTVSDNKCEAKNVFNLPEMSTDMNFVPFVTKSKICRTPSPVSEEAFNFKVPTNLTDTGSQSVNPDGNIMAHIATLDVGSKTDYDSSIASSSSKGTEDATVREVNTEDEDTVEGPFFEADDMNDDEKMSEFAADSEDMMNFNDTLPRGVEENVDNGEMFIDAEAFEFLLNQNKSNMVADSGKESLFLKFDPLFAKRMSSDGVLAALNKLQKRQSTPKRISKTPTIDVTYDKMSTGTLNFNATTEVNSTLENNLEDPNTTVSKPMMVVNPAVNSIISPRNKPTVTPPRANRRSLTFTSPAIAVIDRLLSLSGNNSMLNNETPTRQVHREHNETDLALTQLRELLAEKEIHVHNLRLESKELKERLSTLETQVKSLESESEHRLRKVNELNERLVEKTNINRSMAAVVEEYERTIASLIAETEQDKKRHAEERMRLVNERDEQTAHLASMEISFNDLHSKYEKSKQVILACKSNEDTYRRSIKEFEESLLKMQNNYELLKQHATSKLNQANQELERLNRAHEAEVVKLNAMIKRKDLHITSLEETLAQKAKANEELTAICDELINKVG